MVEAFAEASAAIASSENKRGAARPLFIESGETCRAELCGQPKAQLQRLAGMLQVTVTVGAQVCVRLFAPQTRVELAKAVPFACTAVSETVVLSRIWFTVPMPLFEAYTITAED